jgi:N-acyl-D-amino-acid deacylase
VREELSELYSTGFVAVAGGRIFFEYGDLEAVSYLASVRKSVLSVLFGNYVDAGVIRLDRTLADLRIDDHQGLSDAEKRATVRDLLSARSGVYHPAANSGDDLASAPARGSQPSGAYYLYNNWDFNALGTIFEQETGRNIYDALESDLARPLRMQDFDRARQVKTGDLTASMHPAYHMHLSTRDMARLGHLMLREGRWEDRQLVPRWWVHESTRLRTPRAEMNPERRRESSFGYSYLWWVFDDPRLGPEYEGAYVAHGAVGQHILVMPALDLVVAHKTRQGQPGRVSHEQFHAVVRTLVAAHCGDSCDRGARASSAGPAQQPYDLILRNGRIVDGTGNPWYRGDVAIRDGSIVHVAHSIGGPALRVIDVRGNVIAPGFIDIHTHARRGIFERPLAENYVRQGVTTVIEGPDGSSPVPLGPFLAQLDSLPKSVNIGAFIGQGSIRSEVIGSVDRVATDAELQRMRELVEQGMRDGAFGLSTGLFYVPGTFTPTAEVVELARVAGRFGGIHISHMRDEAARVVQSVAETIRIGEQGGLPTQVTHHKVVGPGYHGASRETLRMIDEARARGIDATIDQYPYTASATSVQSALMPAWALEGGSSQIRSRLQDPALRERIRRETAEIIRLERGGGDPANVVISRCGFDASLAGQSLAQITSARGMEPTIANAAEVTLWLVEQGGCSGVFHAISEEDLERILRHPATMIASDGEIPAFGAGHPHPRSYGTFTRVLGRYVRERGALSLEEAVRKMSAFPAQRLGLLDRGLIRPGMKADIAVFDPAMVHDVATFDRPHQYSEGVSIVLVNGVPVLENGVMTAARPGQVLYGPAQQRAAR